MNIRKLTGRVSWYFIMILLSIVSIYPILFSFLAGFKRNEDFTSINTILPISGRHTLENYIGMLKSAGFLKPFTNSVVRTLFFTFVLTLVCALVGYVLERYEFPGKKIFFNYIMVVQVVPWVLTLVPLYLVMARVPLTGGNNIWGMGGSGLIDNTVLNCIIILPSNLLGIFLFRQSMKTLPRDFEEAAEIDGCGFMRIIFQLIVPLQKPILIVIAITNALWAWTDFLVPYTYMNNSMNLTLSGAVGLMASALLQFGDKQYATLFALSTLTIIPSILIFLFFQKYIVQGLASAGIKG